MSDTTPANDDPVDIQKPIDNPAPAEIKLPDPEPEKPKAEAKKPVDKALAAAAKTAKIEASDVLSFKDYDDKLVIVTRAGQKIVVPK